MYKSESYVEKCPDSLILDENYMQAVEIIVVNDGSTDHSVELVRPCVERYSDTIRLISQENGGHGASVDTGINEYQGASSIMCRRGDKVDLPSDRAGGGDLIVERSDDEVGDFGNFVVD